MTVAHELQQDPRPRRAPLLVVPAVALVPSAARLWARALRLALLPVTLLGPVVGALLVAHRPGVRVAPLTAAILLVVAGHAVAVLVRDLGDARPARAGLLARRTAGRAVLVAAGISLLLLGALVAARGIALLLWPLVAALVVVAAVSRRAGAPLTACAGLAAGAGTLLLAVQAGLGRLPLAAVPAAVAAGAVVAALLLARRHALVPSPPLRVLAALPVGAAGLGVALGALPLPVLSLGLAVPAARRAAQAPGPALVSAARLAAVLLVAALAVSAAVGLR